MVERLRTDHDHTYQIAKAIDDIDSNIFQINLSLVQTNILLIHLDSNVITEHEFLERLLRIKETDDVKISVQGGTLQPNIVRFVLHCEISQENVRQITDKIKMVIRQVHHEVKSMSYKTT
ncbi:hypothetical protein FQR65_LT18702 [Abscondita terminalis]|nr:hypothetical protein FQR65_LT18702 [Abscondita terminalis]